MSQPAYYPLCASENLQIEETGSEVVVFDTQNKKFHFLNPTAHTILKACNGANSIRDIAVMLSGNFGSADPDLIVNDVAEAVSSFQAQGLMMLVADDSELPDAGSNADGSLLAVHVTGSSMFPTLFSGDKVLVKKASLGDLNTGDIVVFTDDAHERIAHRIVSIDPPFITTKGDLQFNEDPPIDLERVIGKLAAVLRDGKVRWISELGNTDLDELADADRRPSYKKMQVLDLRDISVESIRSIGSVEEIGLVLLSPENAEAWSEVPTQAVKTVVTAPRDYRVYTGQPELLPEMLEFSETPLRLIVSGQLFLTSFEPDQIEKNFKELVLVGQAYVNSIEAKMVLERLTRIVSGEISVVPAEHSRWIGQSILGPEYPQHRPLVAIGDLEVSKRLGEIPENLTLFGPGKKEKAVASR